MEIASEYVPMVGLSRTASFFFALILPLAQLKAGDSIWFADPAKPKVNQIANQSFKDPMPAPSESEKRLRVHFVRYGGSDNPFGDPVWIQVEANEFYRVRYSQKLSDEGHDYPFEILRQDRQEFTRGVLAEFEKWHPFLLALVPEADVSSYDYLFDGSKRYGETLSPDRYDGVLDSLRRGGVLDFELEEQFPELDFYSQNTRGLRQTIHQDGAGMTALVMGFGCASFLGLGAVILKAVGVIP